MAGNESDSLPDGWRRRPKRSLSPGLKGEKSSIKSTGVFPDTMNETEIAIARTITLWSSLPEGIRHGWNYHAKGKPLSGYNIFVMSNFEKIKSGGMLELSRGTGAEIPGGLRAAINSSGEISVTFDKCDSGGLVSLFIQNSCEPDPERFVVSKIDFSVDSNPVVLEGFNPVYVYFIYVVRSMGPIENSEMISGSSCCRVISEISD